MGGRPGPRRLIVLAMLLAIALTAVPAVVAIATRSLGSILILVVIVSFCFAVWFSVDRSLASVEVYESADGVLVLSGLSIRGTGLSAPISDITAVTKGNKFSRRRVRLKGQRRLGFTIGRNDLALFLERLAEDLDPTVEITGLAWSLSHPRHEGFFDTSATA